MRFRPITRSATYPGGSGNQAHNCGIAGGELGHRWSQRSSREVGIKAHDSDREDAEARDHASGVALRRRTCSKQRSEAPQRLMEVQETWPLTEAFSETCLFAREPRELDNVLNNQLSRLLDYVNRESSMIIARAEPQLESKAERTRGKVPHDTLSLSRLPNLR